MTGGWRIETRRGRRMFALGWLFLLHLLADLTVAIYRCTAINPSLTDVLAGGLMRAQFGLLCVWLLAGKDPLSWRLAALISGCSWLFLVYSRLLFSFYGTLGWYGFNPYFDLYFRSTGPGDLMLKAPLMLSVLAVALLAWRLTPASLRTCLGSHSATDKLQLVTEESGSRLRWLQFSVADFLIWSFTLGLLITAISTTPPYQGWLTRIRNNWLDGMRGDLADAPLLVWSALPTAAMILLGCLQGQARTGHLRRLIAIIVIGVVVGIAVEACWQAVHPNRSLYHSSTGGLRPSEVLLMPLAGCLAAGTCWLVALYDQPVRRGTKPVALATSRTI